MISEDFMSKNGKEKILYVDDEFINLELFRISFMDDYEVITALSGKEGLKVLDDQDIKVVVSDLRMPVMDGLEFLQEVKQRDEQRVCIILTAYAEPEAMLKAINKEIVFRYIMKPWNKLQLKKEIDDAFAKYNDHKP